MWHSTVWYVCVYARVSRGSPWWCLCLASVNLNRVYWPVLQCFRVFVHVLKSISCYVCVRVWNSLFCAAANTRAVPSSCALDPIICCFTVSHSSWFHSRDLKYYEQNQSKSSVKIKILLPSYSFSLELMSVCLCGIILNSPMLGETKATGLR